MNDYIWETDRMFYKHELSERLPRDVYSMHTHNIYELLYFVKGDATYVIEDKKYKLRPHDLILIRPYEHHFVQIDSTTDYERYDILFDPELHGVEGLDRLPRELAILSLAEDAVSLDLFRRLDLYAARYDRESFMRLLPHLLSELFYSVSLSPGTAPVEGSITSPLLSEALRYINENLFTVRNTREIAAKLFVSESYLFRLFKRELHQTPKKYIRDKRLLLADRMIALGERPTRVAATCGFADYTTFYRNYIALFGRPPSE